MFNRFLHSKRAFTLIELLVVILIIGILIAIAAPSFLGQQDKAHDSAAWQNLAISRKAAKSEFTSAGQEKYPAAIADVVTAFNKTEPQNNYVAFASQAVDADHQTIQRLSDTSVVVCTRSRSSKQEVFCFKTFELGNATIASVAKPSSPVGYDEGSAYAANKPLVENTPDTCWARAADETAAHLILNQPDDMCITDPGNPTSTEFCAVPANANNFACQPPIIGGGGPVINSFGASSFSAASVDPDFYRGDAVSITYDFSTCAVGTPPNCGGVFENYDNPVDVVDDVHVQWQYCPVGEAAADSTSCLPFTADNAGVDNDWYDWHFVPQTIDDYYLPSGRDFVAPAASPLGSGTEYEARAAVSVTITKGGKTYNDILISNSKVLTSEELPQDPIELGEVHDNSGAGFDLAGDFSLQSDNVTIAWDAPSSDFALTRRETMEVFVAWCPSTMSISDTATLRGLQFISMANNGCTHATEEINGVNINEALANEMAADGSLSPQSVNLDNVNNRGNKLAILIKGCDQANCNSNPAAADYYTRYRSFVSSGTVARINYSGTSFDDPANPALGQYDLYQDSRLSGDDIIPAGEQRLGGPDPDTEILDVYSNGAHTPRVVLQACPWLTDTTIGTCADTGIELTYSQASGDYGIGSLNGHSLGYTVEHGAGGACSLDGPFHNNRRTIAYDGASSFLRMKVTFFNRDGSVNDTYASDTRSWGTTNCHNVYED